MVDPPFRPARFDDDVPAVDIAEFVKALPEFLQRGIGRGGRGGRASAEKPHTRHFARLLRPGEGNAKDASKSEYHGARGLLEVHGNPSFLSHLQQTLGRAAEREAETDEASERSERVRRSVSSRWFCVCVARCLHVLR